VGAHLAFYDHEPLAGNINSICNLYRMAGTAPDLRYATVRPIQYGLTAIRLSYTIAVRPHYNAVEFKSNPSLTTHVLPFQLTAVPNYTVW